MADGEIKLGDIVQLKSGGPRMTVKNIGTYPLHEETCADCEWFVQDKPPWKKASDVFPLHSLKKLAD